MISQWYLNDISRIILSHCDTLRGRVSLLEAAWVLRCSLPVCWDPHYSNVPSSDRPTSTAAVSWMVVCRLLPPLLRHLVNIKDLVYRKITGKISYNVEIRFPAMFNINKYKQTPSFPERRKDSKESKYYNTEVTGHIRYLIDFKVMELAAKKLSLSDIYCINHKLGLRSEQWAATGDGRWHTCHLPPPDSDIVNINIREFLNITRPYSSPVKSGCHDVTYKSNIAIGCHRYCHSHWIS